MTGAMFIAQLLFGLLACQPKIGPSSVSVNVQQTQWTEESSIEVLRSGTNHSDPSIRAAAIAAWIESKHHSRDALATWVLADPSAHVQRTAAQSASRAAMVLTVHESTDAVARIMAQERALGTEQLKASVDLIREGDFPADAFLLDLLVERSGKQLRSILVDGVALAEEPMRLPMAIAAVRLDAEGAIQTLDGVVSDGEGSSVFVAIESLADAKGRQTQMWLEKIAKRNDGAAALHADIGLVALGKRPLSVALEAMESPDRDTRAWAATAIGKGTAERTLPREAIVRLQNSLRDESLAVRTAGAMALLASVGVEFVPLRVDQSLAQPNAVSMIVAGRWLSRHFGEEAK